MPLLAPAATRHRVPSGVRFAPSLRDRLRRPLGTLVQDGDGRTSRRASLPVMPPADPSPRGGSLRSRPLFVPAQFPPKIPWGGELDGCDSGSGFAAFAACYPLPSPSGGGGEKGARGCFKDRFRWSLESGRQLPPALCCRIAGSDIVRPATVRNDISSEVIVDKLFDQRRAIQTHHRGVNV